MTESSSTMLRLTFICLALLYTTVPAFADAKLFETFGGETGITSLADDLINRALADPRIQHSFDDSNIKRVKRELASQFCELLGGPCVYKGRDMKEAHQKLMITDAQFNALVEDLQDAMAKLDIPFGAQNQLLAKLAPMHATIVTK